MRTGVSRYPLGAQFVCLLVLVALLGGFMALVLMGRAYLAAAQSRAETIANLVEDVGAWASKYKGMWAKSEAGNVAAVGDYLDSVPLYKPDERSNGIEAASTAVPILTPAMAAEVGLSPADMKALATMSAGGFHQKNPALIQRELSEVTNASGHAAKFRMTSDKCLNPNNAPDRFELDAIEAIRERQSNDYVEIRGNRLLYARRLTVTPECMKCHDAPDKAPAAVRAKFPDPKHGYGYKVGDVAGVISVSVPVVEAQDDILKQMGGMACSSIVGFLASLLLLLWFVSAKVLAPLKWLTKAAIKASEGDLVSQGRAIDDRVGAGDEKSGNEVDQMGVAIKRLLRSLMVTSGRR